MNKIMLEDSVFSTSDRMSPDYIGTYRQGLVCASNTREFAHLDYYAPMMRVGSCMKILRDHVNCINAHWRMIYRNFNMHAKHNSTCPIKLTVHEKGRRGRNNPHPYFKENNTVGHIDGYCPKKYAQRVDIYLRRSIDKNHAHIRMMNMSDYLGLVENVENEWKRVVATTNVDLEQMYAI